MTTTNAELRAFLEKDPRTFPPVSRARILELLDELGRDANAYLENVNLRAHLSHAEGCAMAAEQNAEALRAKLDIAMRLLQEYRDEHDTDLSDCTCVICSEVAQIKEQP